MSPTIKPQSRSAGSEAAGLCQSKQLPRRLLLLNHTLLLPSASHPVPAPHWKPWSEQSTAGTCEQPLTQPGSHCCAIPESREGTAGKELCRRSLDSYKSIGTPKDTNKPTKPKAAPTAVNLPNGRDSSRKTIFPSATLLLCYFNYPRELTDGFLSGSLFTSHTFCLFRKTDLITPTCTWPALTHW